MPLELEGRQEDAEQANRQLSLSAASAPNTTATASASSGPALPRLPVARKAPTATVGLTEMTVPEWTHFRRSAEGCAEPLDELEVALDAMCSIGTPFYYRYTILSAVERRGGGQGVVQFASMANTQQKVAIKFYLDRHAFRRERELYMESQLRTMMPATLAIEDNASGAVATPYGYQFPPFVIIECGQSLDEFARRNAADFVTIFQALSHAVRALAKLHSMGYAHRDIKPGNILRRHQQHDWTLIDFGCTAHIGTVTGLSYSLRYAAPEVIRALEAGEKTIKVDTAGDIWAIGVVAFELLTGERAFATEGLEPADAEQAILDAISGRTRLPWEGGTAISQLEKLRGLKRTVLRCLEREPGRRPSSEALLHSWDHMFDNLQTQGTLFTRTEA